MNATPQTLRDALAKTVVGQAGVLDGLLLALISDGHAVLEGPPGLAKTLACKALAAALNGSFKRIQFTPDLLPSDIVGTRMYDQRSADFTTMLGPIFANVVLADEINRAPAKVQSALLEAMQERQVTIGQTTHALPSPFLVLATMNPLDSDGTYALPLAQLDRFIVKIEVSYPTFDDELAILERFAINSDELMPAVATLDDVRRWRSDARSVHLDDKLKRYIVELVTATRPEYRNPAFSQIHGFIECGASPRATLAIAHLCRARAYLDTRDFVLPDDVRAVAILAMRHRVAFNHRIITENESPGALLARLIAAVAAP